MKQFFNYNFFLEVPKFREKRSKKSNDIKGKRILETIVANKKSNNPKPLNN